MEKSLESAREELRLLREQQARRDRQQNDVERILTSHREAIEAAGGRVQEILQSRIWRTLVWLGGWFVSPRKPKARPEGPPEIRATQGAPRSGRRLLTGASTAKDCAELVRNAAGACRRPMSGRPRISVVTAAWNTPISSLAASALSVLEQSSTQWEWCIVDDGSAQTDFRDLLPILESTHRVKTRRLKRRQGVSGALNEAMRLAAGEHVCFLTPGDQLEPAALEACLTELDRGFDVVYTDHDVVNGEGQRKEAFYKPDWSPEYLRGVMYIGNLLCVRRETALSIGGFDARYDGIEDFEFMLRCSERTQRIGHLSTVLYHRRLPHSDPEASQEPVGGTDELQNLAVQAHLKRLQLPALAEPGALPGRVRIAPRPLASQPLVSILIPSKDEPELLGGCLRSVMDKTTYGRFEIVCIDNESTDPRALQLMESYRVKRVLFTGRFNFSQANNLGARAASGEYLVFMNNDIEAITERWIEEMLYYAQQRDVGAVGALLLYPDLTVQHAGVVLGCRGTADHVSRRASAGSDGYHGSLSCAREVSAVTAACMMLSRTAFEQAGGFFEEYCTAYQDVDLCLQLRAQGFRNIFTPHARFFHKESQTRGNYYDLGDRRLLLDRWGKTIAARDPYYNRNFDVEACNYTLKSEQ
ncbi:MAG TPA: glycosyltransferase family 2 protein [Bryobacteraceae bacterium]|nr:glycosyltransferase family 2 protein [Bryobacteraceae bacterium]